MIDLLLNIALALILLTNIGIILANLSEKKK